MKCKTCYMECRCDEQTKFDCKNNDYYGYGKEYWIELHEFIEEFNKHSFMESTEDRDFFDAWELKMAKAFLHDSPEASVRISKIILALKDINDVKVKIE